MNDTNLIPTVYLSRLSLRNIKCFKEEYNISFADAEGKPVLWTVFLGNNNTGKTTLLRLLGSPSILNKSHWGLQEVDTLSKSILKIQNKASASYYWVTSVGMNGQDIYNPNLPMHLTESMPGWLPKYSDSSNSIKHINPENRLFIDGYGISRKPSNSTLVDYADFYNSTKGLFFDDELLVNAEEWLLQLDYANKSNVAGAKQRLDQLQQLILSHIFPDLLDLRFETKENFKPSVSFLTSYGWVKLHELSYGYQTTIAWVVDLAKRMFDRYPDLDNPLHGPAIVLVDEIDLHLHPEWQRKIIKYLSDLFPNTQFIVTAHSPLIVQSAENVNLIMLEKDDETGSINVRQQFGSFQGWTVEEILRELMDMGEKTRSDRYLELMRQFEDALLAEDYIGVKTAYSELDKILSPSSHQRKVLQIQMSSLIPA